MGWYMMTTELLKRLVEVMIEIAVEMHGIREELIKLQETLQDTRGIK